jgi:H+/Cl- antiporter ClcA/CBS domain-containing protein
MESTTTQGLPVAPSIEPAFERAGGHRHDVLLPARSLLIALISVGLAFAAAVIAEVLTSLIGLVTNFAYYGRWSTEFTSPSGNHLGVLAIAVPVIGGLIVGIMARYGSQAIRGHGIPEAMEQVLFNQSRIPARITVLKPLSAAVAIGTGGPFGAEGPIIATGGALGSLIGQLLETTAAERKTLLAAGAAAGMTAIFGSPISSVLLAIELLLFEFRPRSFVPVALAATVAAGLRYRLHGGAPVFAMPAVDTATLAALALYVAEGALIGAFAAGVTWIVYWIEDMFEHLPVHWMWWPAIGALVVGIVGVISPKTLGVGYDNITDVLNGSIAGEALIFFCAMKFISWSIALGSGTSGGTLAPLFTIGGGAGAALGALAAMAFPSAGVDPHVAALVGMAATFAGASRALLASIVFSFEVTGQPNGLVPLLGGCVASYVVSALLMRRTIMTEKIGRRGREVPAEYHSDPLELAIVADYARAEVVTLSDADRLGDVRAKLASSDSRYHHQGFPVIGARDELVGVATRRDLLDTARSESEPVSAVVKRPPVTISRAATLRQAADIMARAGVGRLPVVDSSGKLEGILTRSDLLAVHADVIRMTSHAERTIRWTQARQDPAALEERQK